MDQPWYSMTEDEQDHIRQLSADLYTIGDRNVAAPPSDDLRAALVHARDERDWMKALTLLQEHPGLAPPAERALLRGEAWAGLGVIQAASLFIEDAIRAARPPAPARNMATRTFPRLGRVAKAA